MGIINEVVITIVISVIIFFSPADSLSLSLSGEFRIPPSVPTELIVDFLVKHKQKSLDLCQENNRYVFIHLPCAPMN